MAVICEKHGIKYLTRCIKCVREHMDSPEGQRERAEFLARFSRQVEVVMPFAEKLKRRMLDLRKFSVRVRCPQHPKDQVHWVTARIAGSRNHLHFACDDPDCMMRMME